MTRPDDLAAPPIRLYRTPGGPRTCLICNRALEVWDADVHEACALKQRQILEGAGLPGWLTGFPSVDGAGLRLDGVWDGRAW